MKKIIKKSSLLILSVSLIAFLFICTGVDSASNVLRVTRGGTGVTSISEGQFLIGSDSSQMQATSSISIDSVGNITVAKQLTAASLAISGVVVGNISLDDNWLTNDGDDEGLRIDDDGKVGIGTTTPAYTLDVEGDIRGAYYSSNGTVGWSGTCDAASSTVVLDGIITGCN